MVFAGPMIAHGAGRDRICSQPRRKKKMNDETIVVNDESLPAIADNTLIQLAEQAEKRIDAMQKIKKIALKLTNKHDWTDQAGKPYLQVSGAEKVARLFGISWRISEPVLENEEGGHYSFTYKGYFSLAGATIECIGTRSSKDGFFKKYSWDKDENGQSKKTDLPPSAIDRGDVKKAALTNLLGNGITRILGLRNLTYEDLQEYAGITQDQIQKVEYKSKGDKKESTPVGSHGADCISDAQRKRLFAIYKGAGKTDAEVKKYLLDTFKVESSNDIPKSKYEEICKWAETKAQREPGENG
jgi:hypothetical protein